MNPKFVSIVIPTYKDWQRLQQCLYALESQSYPMSLFEIIVVNNCSTDNLPENFHLPKNTTLIHESKPGSYAARNAGLAIAKGEIIGFTDSDCIPSMHWIEQAVECFSNNPSFTRIAGKIELFYTPGKRNAAELYESVYAFPQKFAASIGVSVTGNMFALKYVFDAIGNFNESLMSGGDTEWSLRAKKNGYKIIYGEDVTVKHPARNELKELIKKSKRIGNYYGRSKWKALARSVKLALPPLRSFIKSSHLAVPEKITVFKVRYMLNVIRSYEEIRISFGKTPNRS